MFLLCRQAHGNRIVTFRSYSADGYYRKTAEPLPPNLQRSGTARRNLGLSDAGSPRPGLWPVVESTLVAIRIYRKRSMDSHHAGNELA